MKRTDWFTAISYWFIHFSVEVLCFYILEARFGAPSEIKWVSYLIFDTIAFATQPLIGSLCEKYTWIRPGIIGGILLTSGGVIALADTSAVLTFLGLIIFTLGNATLHISGAIATSRASEGRLSESAIFVGGGSFGVITGRMLAAGGYSTIIPIAISAATIPLAYITDRRIRARYGEEAYNFTDNPVKHDIATDRNKVAIILILALIVVGRGFIGYGLPTGWNRLSIHTILLFIFMGCGKMLGGILSDIFGARTIGIISCVVALPVLLVSNEMMWLSLIGISLFSMTMAITLGGLFSVMKYTPGTAFGITTIGLLLGSIPLFFVKMPSQTVCNILNICMSVFATLGILYCIKKKSNVKEN